MKSKKYLYTLVNKELFSLTEYCYLRLLVRFPSSCPRPPRLAPWSLRTFLRLWRSFTCKPVPRWSIMLIAGSSPVAMPFILLTAMMAKEVTRWRSISIVGSIMDPTSVAVLWSTMAILRPMMAHSMVPFFRPKTWSEHEWWWSTLTGVLTPGEWAARMFLLPFWRTKGPLEGELVMFLVEMWAHCGFFGFLYNWSFCFEREDSNDDCGSQNLFL